MTSDFSVGDVRFAACVSESDEATTAAREACLAAREQLGRRPDLALAFVSSQYQEGLRGLGALIVELTGANCLLGCTCESLVANEREIEQKPAVAVWLASLPGVSVTPMHLEFQRTADGGTIVGWPDEVAREWEPGAAIFLLGDPYSFPTDVLLERLNDSRPGAPVVGGMASGASQPGENWLFLGDKDYQEGAVAVLVQGPVRIRSVVSQGCRPIGRPYVVTKVERNIILELGGKPPLLRLQEVVTSLSARERAQAQQGLHVGLVINEYQPEFGRGDFLVRNCLGADPGNGAIAIGDYPRVGQTVQFHMRDASTADEDLRELLADVNDPSDEPSRGALLFTCNGRGTRLFGTPDHDAGVLRAALGDVPVAGFFAQGELGPIGGRNFVHGFTASVALFDKPR